MCAETSTRPQEDDIPDAAALPKEVAFLLDYGASGKLLREAAARAVDHGVPADVELIASGEISEERFFRSLADRLRLRYYDGKPPLSPKIGPSLAIRAGLARLAPNALRLRAALAPRGLALTVLIAAQDSGRPIRNIAICAPGRLATLIRTHAAVRVARDAAGALEMADRSLSARSGATVAQTVGAAMVIAGCAALALCSLEAARLALSGLLLLLFMGAVWLRSVALAAGRALPAMAALPDFRLPRYTIVAALRREASVAPDLMRALDALDYPRAKLDIKIVVEADDIETREAIEALRPRSHYRLIVAPPGAPLTKPRALNVALGEAQGDLLTVFDAEDKPSPGQLRRAAERFAAEPGIDCLQARLVIDNGSDSWLSANFALEYSTLFDFVNPGLAALDLPIPLGGTSNHFRVRTLRRVGGWDAWNVTEDADLGVRLARFGARVATLDSDTLEEAPHQLRNWFRQRVRWQKGWLQTLVTHSRNPLRVTRELGPLRALAAFLTIAGTVATGLFGTPLFLEALVREFVASAEPGPIGRAIDVATYVLVLWGAQIVIIPALIAQRRRRITGAYRALATTPLYYLLIFAASWTALIEWFVHPFHWGKTEHGLRKQRADLSATSRACAPPDPLSARRRQRASVRPAAPARQFGRNTSATSAE